MNPNKLGFAIITLISLYLYAGLLTLFISFLLVLAVLLITQGKDKLQASCNKTPSIKRCCRNVIMAQWIHLRRYRGTYLNGCPA